MNRTDARRNITTPDGLLFFDEGREFTSRSLRASSDFKPPRHLLICGNGRGGTTAAATVIRELGLETQNPNVFLESIDLRKHSKRQDAAAALAAITRWDQGEARQFWKEPKLKSAALHHMLPSVQKTVGFLFVFRDPLNVALRNDALGGMGGFEALLEAERGTQKMLTAIAALRDRQTALMSYEKLLTMPEQVVAGLAYFLGIANPDVQRRAVAAIEPNSAIYQTNVTNSKRPFGLRRPIA